jgi:hypothetical protein
MMRTIQDENILAMIQTLIITLVMKEDDIMGAINRKPQEDTIDVSVI